MYRVVIQVVFVSVVTGLTDLIKPPYYSSCVCVCVCVCVCQWVQALLSRKSSQTALSKLLITKRIPPEKRDIR
jgi:hypothetical protein